MGENFISKVEKLEKSLHRDNKISLIFLLYDDDNIKVALQCCILCLDSNTTSPLLDWALKHGGDQSTEWTKKLFEALSITENYQALNILFGITKKQADSQYLPKNEFTSLSVSSLRKKLYLICEQLDNEECTTLVHHMMKNCPGSEEKYNSLYLEIYFLEWLENGTISRFNLNNLIQTLNVMEKTNLVTSLEIIKKKEKQTSSSSSAFQEYKVDPNNMGTCIIINQKKFHSLEKKQPLSTRIGTDVDRDKLRETFLMFGYKVEIWENLLYTDLFTKLRSISMKIKATDSSLVVCILSHGVKDGIACSDGTHTSISSIKSMFTPDNCPVLAGKPKIFFVQACQGDDYQRVVSYEVPPDESGSNLATDSPNPQNLRIQSVAKEADILMCYATVSGYVAFRDEITGSPYIRQLCKNLIKHSQEEDLSRILGEVNKHTSSTELVKGNQRFTAMPVVSTTLGGLLRFTYNEEGVVEATRRRMFRSMLSQLLREFLQNYCVTRNNLT